MTEFFDWLTAGDAGLSVDRLAERFRLSQEEMRRTGEALLPAFMLGLQRAAADPGAWGELSSRFAAFMPGHPLHGGENPTGDAADNLLDGLFGSKALTAAVARQVSMASGIAPDTVEKLMPGLAVMTVEAMLRMMMANLARNQPPGLATGDYGGALAEMMRRGANAVEAMNRPSDQGRAAAKPFGSDYVEQMFAGALHGGFPWMPGEAARPPGPAAAPAGAAPTETAMPNPFLPFAAMAEAFAAGMRPQPAGGETTGDPQHPSGGGSAGGTREPGGAAAGGAAVGGEPAPAREASTGTGEPAAPDAGTQMLLSEMMRSGQKMQDQYAREMMALFERYQAPDRQDRGGN